MALQWCGCLVKGRLRCFCIIGMTKFITPIDCAVGDNGSIGERFLSTNVMLETQYKGVTELILILIVES